MLYNKLITRERVYEIRFLLIDGLVYKKDEWVDVNKETWDFVKSLMPNNPDKLHPNDIGKIMDDRLITIGRRDLEARVHGAYIRDKKLVVYIDICYIKGFDKKEIEYVPSKCSKYIWFVNHPNGKKYMVTHKGEHMVKTGVEINEKFIKEFEKFS